MEMSEGFRLGEFCELLHRSPSEVGELSRRELVFLSAYLNERNKRLNKAFGGS